MTRLERLHKQLQDKKAALALAQEHYEAKEAEHRAELDKALNKRRYHVGALVHEAGLFVLENSTLTALFQVLATLKDLPDPVGMLESLLSDPAVANAWTAASAATCLLTSLQSDSSAVSRQG